jgi:murein DD-endopeptidase MepM/ murein hydrolase activator NlpD
MNSTRSRIRVLACSVLAGLAVLWMSETGPAGIRDLFHLYFGTPHERYAAELRLDGAEGAAANTWFESAKRSLTNPVLVQLPNDRLVRVARDQPTASAFVMKVKRGQRFIADAAMDGAVAGALFVDVFERNGAALRHVAHAPQALSHVAIEVRADADYIVRVQPDMFQIGAIAVSLRTEPTLLIPVEGATAKNVQSFFGADRDGGRRAHHGVDIFAERRTPVRAAASGIVMSVGTNGLGGNIVWITRPMRGESHYYAHLDRQLVTAGTYVKEGDVIGLVGNTGNARGTAPHLHFGIYTAGGPVDPLPYISQHSRRPKGLRLPPRTSSSVGPPRTSSSVGPPRTSSSVRPPRTSPSVVAGNLQPSVVAGNLEPSLVAGNLQVSGSSD